MILFWLSFGSLFISVMMRVSQMTREGHDGQVGVGLPATLAVTRVIFLGAFRPVKGHRRQWPSIISYPVIILLWQDTFFLRFHVTSPILGERISTIVLPQQRKQWLLVESNSGRSERIHCYFFNNKKRTLIIIM